MLSLPVIGQFTETSLPIKLLRVPVPRQLTTDLWLRPCGGEGSAPWPGCPPPGSWQTTPSAATPWTSSPPRSASPFLKRQNGGPSANDAAFCSDNGGLLSILPSCLTWVLNIRGLQHRGSKCIGTFTKLELDTSLFQIAKLLGNRYLGIHIYG